MNNNKLDQILSYKDSEHAMRLLSQVSGLGSPGRASQVYERLAPVVAESMAKAGQSPETANELWLAARGLTWLERTNPETLFENGPETLFENDNGSFGRGLGRIIFGNAMPGWVSSVAANAELTETNAAVLLEVISAVSLSVMAGHPDSPLSSESLAAALATIAPQHEATPTAVVQTSDPVAQPVAQPIATAPAAVAPVTAPVASNPQPVAAAATQPRMAEERSKTPLLIGAAVGLLAIVGIGLFALGGGSNEQVDQPETLAFDDEDTASSSETATTTSVVEADDEPSETEEAAPVDGDSEASETEEASPGDDGGIEPVSALSSDVVSLSVPMLDIIDPERGASGVLNFDLNTVSGEVCYSVESINIEGPYRSHIHVGGYGVQGGIVVDLGPLESGAVGCVDNLPVDTNAILANRSGHYAELHDISEEWTIRGQLSETIDGDVVSISVPMINDQGVSPDAAGVLNFDFNTVSGEVCYTVESTNIEGPYRSHIHVGNAGVQGGIVVDLGPLESGAVGCVDNLPIDTNAILANKAGHYAELHDISEEWTIRGQLSESVVIDDGVGVESLVDAEGGGASILLDGGTVYLEGAVPDQATADEMFVSLSGLAASTPVVNNLTVEADAPLPSGRVVIADAVFFDVASDEIRAIDSSTLEAITALALSREDWVLTVVGHTDDQGSDVANLELSLRRAAALRDLLADQGVPNANLRIRGAGETAPIGDNSTAAGRAQNRRIEFEFTPSS